ncbi:L-lysine 6-transaminase [candidate division KSB1 bacterium]|nr:L-lysine 6-transaminase [candidate division KSB1 bacterium]
MLVDGYSEIVVDLQKSEGNYIYDSLSGRKYLDMFSYFATAPIGHNHPAMHDLEFKEKILSVAIMKPSNSDFYSTEMAEFVQTFSKYAIPEHLPYLFLVSGGALAVENALKAAFDWKVRRNFQKGIKEEKGSQVIHFKEAFHGRSGYTLSLTNTDKRKTKYFPKFNWPRITNPKILFPFNEVNLDKVVALENQAIDEIKAAIHECSDDIAAMIIEPIQGEGGDNHFRKEFFQKLRTVADESDILLIFDEVQTGIGLTGKMWCYEHFGVNPDMLVFGKKTQVCGFLCSKRIDEVDDNVFHESGRLNSTWGGNLVDMVRFRKYLEIIVTDKLIENTCNVGEYFSTELLQLEDGFDNIVSRVRGRGFMIAFDLPNSEIRNQFLSKTFENGLIVLPSGERSIRFRPSLNLPGELVDETLGILRESLADVLNMNGASFARVKDEAKAEL